MKLTPLHDRIIVKPAPAEETTKSGIIIPDTAKEKPLQGEIIACGQGRIDDNGKLIAMQLKVGDNVLYGKYAGTEITIDGEELLMMKETDVFAIIG
ncbi:MAG: co-chaperone GroES [Ignavibacteria bacterium]|jgi:chaperonin GroES|nr:co-chaperone GroES [Ignavibacteria bacterium]